ncbi:MAG: DUF4197 domain-containing protein [Steroidobacteraceae bacterium]
MNADKRIAAGLLAVLVLCLGGLRPVAAAADALDLLSSKDAASGLRAALGQGIDAAVAHLGVTDGFLKNPKVTIPLPPALQKAERGLRLLGRGDDAEALKLAMNHAAEAAVAEARPVLRQALKSMTLQDAKGILGGGDDAGTQYFQRTTATSLTARFKPIVASATAKLKIAALYDQYAGKAAALGLVRNEDTKLDDYVTAKALAGLYTVMADEERAIRKDPLGQASSLIKKVFGAVKQ